MLIGRAASRNRLDVSHQGGRIVPGRPAVSHPPWDASDADGTRILGPNPRIPPDPPWPWAAKIRMAVRKSSIPSTKLARVKRSDIANLQILLELQAG